LTSFDEPVHKVDPHVFLPDADLAMQLVGNLAVESLSMASESALPRWRAWLQAGGDPGIAAFKNWICTEVKANVADVACAKRSVGNLRITSRDLKRGHDSGGTVPGT